MAVNSWQKHVIWGHSSAGRALAWHARGQEFDPPCLHHIDVKGFMVLNKCYEVFLRYDSL